jgi:mRNA interferase RelE/StbE
MIYKVNILCGAIKQLELLPSNDYRAIKSKIVKLSENPRPHGYKKLKGRPAFRIRQGKYRIIYEIYENDHTVKIIRIGHRKNVYR